MKRTFSATLRFLRSDLTAAGVIALLILLLAAGLGVMMALLDSPQNAPLVMMLTLIFGNGICAMVFSMVYFSNWFPTLLAFPANRRGLLAAISLFCLGLTAGLLLLTLLAGALCTLALGAVLGCTLAMPWQVTPWFVWPLALLLPPLLGLVMGGVQIRFGPRAFWALYFGFLILCTTTSHWLPTLLDRLAPDRQLALAAAPCVGLLVLAALSVRWLLRAAVR